MKAQRQLILGPKQPTGMKVTRLPLSRLPTHLGEATRLGDLGAEAIRNLLKAGPVRFVIADVGAPLHWVPEGDCFKTWKRDILLHVADPDQIAYLERFPGDYVYFASQWDDGSIPIVLLAKSH
jgi:hypothetical protein